MIEISEGWPEAQTILVVLAHPDDPEFFCGGSIARWASQGHSIHYLLLTRGDKGAPDRNTQPEALAHLREKEQQAAAAIMGAKSVEFLRFRDGELLPTLEARKAVVRAIRKHRPEILVSCDPLNYYPLDTYINHPDHRAAGEIALGAVFPAAGNPMYYSELIDEEGLQPHQPREVWLSSTMNANMVLDITDTWDIRLRALHEHRSQIGADLEKFDARMRSRRTPESTDENPRYEDRFHKLIFR